jgi:hypothetical protein
VRCREQPAAGLALLVEQDDIEAGAAGAESRKQSCRAGAYHQNLGMTMGVVVALGIGLERRAAVARRVANHLLVAGPQHPGGLERLVVEPRRHELRKTPAEAL